MAGVVATGMSLGTCWLPQQLGGRQLSESGSTKRLGRRIGKGRVEASGKPLAPGR